MVKKSKKRTKDEMNKVIHWAPRILMLIYIGMLNYFALTIQSPSIIKFIPVIFLIIFLGIAWHWQIVGGLTIFALGIIFGLFFEAFIDPAGFVFMILPLWLIGILFLVDHQINA
jgi:hypothetical protein